MNKKNKIKKSKRHFLNKLYLLARRGQVLVVCLNNCLSYDFIPMTDMLLYHSNSSQIIYIQVSLKHSI